MTKQRNRPGVGVYFALILLLLCGYYLFFDMTRVPGVSYAQVEDLFRREQVQSFYVKDGSELYLSLRDGATVRNELGSTDRFREELGELIREQKAAGILVDYDFAPVYRPPWWSEILLYVLLIGGIFLVWQYMMIRAQSGGGSMDQGKRFGKARIRFGSDSEEKTDFEQVAGAREEKEELQEIVGFLKEPKRYLDLGARIPKGVLLVGPPGTGKTLLAKAVAGEAGVQFLSISGSDFVELYVGVGAGRVRDLFDQAKKDSPAIIFIDEIDAVGRQRGAGLGGGHDEREQTLNQLLVEMDGFAANEGVVVLAATNRVDILDPALLRPGRFDRQVYVGEPDVKGREEILRVHARNKPLGEDVNLADIARGTAGFTGADLENLMNESALRAARFHRPFIIKEDIEESVIKVLAGPEKKSRKVIERERRLTAYHEAGHALVIHALPTQDPVHQITIVPRGTAAGMTINRPQEDRDHVSQKRLEETLSTLLGGRCAEETALGFVCTGAVSDLERATAIARDMVTKYGMSGRLGHTAFGAGHDEVFIGRSMAQAKPYSEETAALIDREVKALLDGAYERCRDILRRDRDKLELVAQYLLAHESMDAAQFQLAYDDPAALDLPAEEG